jgi:hypothetical protein
MRTATESTHTPSRRSRNQKPPRRLAATLLSLVMLAGMAGLLPEAARLAALGPSGVFSAAEAAVAGTIGQGEKFFSDVRLLLDVARLSGAAGERQPAAVPAVPQLVAEPAPAAPAAAGGELQMCTLERDARVTAPRTKTL